MDDPPPGHSPMVCVSRESHNGPALTDLLLPGKGKMDRTADPILGVTAASLTGVCEKG